jgi:ABC-2 type transport system ATP-binding protein
LAHVIETSKLRKNYGTGADAVRELDIAVEEGETFGLVGPNGAGKTTVVKMLTTLVRPTSGSARVGGFDIATEKAKVRKVIGYLPQQLTADDTLTGYENLLFYAKLYGLTGRLRRQRIEEGLAIVGLSKWSDSIVSTYSGGMKRRLELASVLVCRPRILFLDEPSLGLDPRSRNLVWDFLRKLRDSFEVTIFLTTNYMDEADRLCDRLAIIDLGKVVTEGSPAKLRESLRGEVLTLKINPPDADLRTLFELKNYAKKIERSEESIRLILNGTGEIALPAVISSLQGAGIEIVSITMHKPNLDDVFTAYTAKTLDHGTAADIPPESNKEQGHKHPRWYEDLR